jgi:hypothetical protein
MAFTLSKSLITMASAVTLAVALSLAPLMAQTGQGSISGRVTDPKGALVANAKVMITNNETLSTITTDTNGGGLYNVPTLNPGSYSVAVTRKGFERSVIQDITVSVGGTVEIDVKLSIGREDVSITVEAADALLSNTSDVAVTVDHQLVEDLPYPERSALEAILLVPGVNGDPTQSGGLATENPAFTVGYVTPAATIAVGGTPPGGTSILVDGSDVLQASFPRTGVNLSGQNVQESTVIVGGMSAKYGRTGTGVVLQGSRSGTDQYHGMVSWRHTDPGFNAYPLSATQRSGLHQNFFGAYVGGPVWIPGLPALRRKTFFFGGFEPARNSNTLGYRGTFPTPAELSGHFAGSTSLAGGHLYYQTAKTNAQGFPYGPLVGTTAYTAIPNDDVSVQLANNPFAQFVLGNFPTPTNPGPYVKFDNANGTQASDFTNSSYERGVINTDNRYSFRIDEQINNSNRVFVRYTVIPVFGARFLGFAIDNPLNGSPSDKATTHDIAIGYTHILTNNIVNNFRYSWMRVKQERLPPPGTLNADYAGEYGLTPAVLGKGFPYLGSFITTNEPISVQAGQAGAFASINVDQNFIAGDDISWTHGTHLIQFGVDFRWIQTSQYDLSGLYGGKYSFNASSTSNGSLGGSPMASFILGSIGTFSNTPLSVPAYYRWHYYAGYIQDDWRATSRLTINMGLRYDLETPRAEKFNNQAVAIDSVGTLNGQPTNSAFCFSQACGTGKTLWPINFKGFEPRVGIAFAATSRMSLRANYTLSRLPLTGYEPQPTPDPDFNVASANVGGVNGGVTAGQIVNYITNPVAGPLTSSYTALLPLRGAPILSSTGFAPTYVRQNDAVPYLQSWGLTIQYQPAKKTVIQTTYQGVHGVHMVGPFTNPRNSASLSSIISAVQQGTYLGGGGTANIYGITNPGATSPLLETNLQRLYPYQNFFNQNLFEIYPRYGTLHYDGLYVSVNQRLSKDLTFLTSYAWSKSLDNIPDSNSATAGGFGVSTSQNPFDLNGEYSLSSFDQPSRFRAGYAYTLPFGVGKLLSTKHNVLDRILGDFSTSGIVTSASGFPNRVTLGSVGYFDSLTPQNTQGCPASKTTLYCVTAALPSGYTLRPSFVPGVPIINPNWKKNPFNSLAGITPYLNPAAFTVPGSPNNPALGNVPRTLGNARSPREFFFDARVVKHFVIERRYQFNLAANFQNAFNHPIYYGVASSTLLSSTAVTAATGTFTNNYATNFGNLNGGTTGNMSRVISFNAEMRF